MTNIALEALKLTEQSSVKSVNLKMSQARYLKLESSGKLGQQSDKVLVEGLVNLVVS